MSGEGKDEAYTVGMKRYTLQESMARINPRTMNALLSGYDVVRGSGGQPLSEFFENILRTDMNAVRATEVVVDQSPLPLVNSAAGKVLTIQTALWQVDYKIFMSRTNDHGKQQNTLHLAWYAVPKNNH